MIIFIMAAILIIGTVLTILFLWAGLSPPPDLKSDTFVSGLDAGGMSGTPFGPLGERDTITTYACGCQIICGPSERPLWRPLHDGDKIIMEGKPLVAGDPSKPVERTGSWSVCCRLCCSPLINPETARVSEFLTKESVDKFAQANGWGIPSTHNGRHLCPRCLAGLTKPI